jgi:3-dehydroquinate dehydratase II
VTAPRSSSASTVVVLHGPSLSLLGTREPALYGTATLAELDKAIAREAALLGLAVRARQSNHEGVIIDELIAAAADPDVAGVVLNAGAYAHTSLAIADAIRAIAPLRVVEVHLTNTAGREGSRRRAVVGAAAWGRIEGLGPAGYALAVRALAGGAEGG